MFLPLVNDGRIILDGTTGTSALIFGDSSDRAISIGGTGRIVLDNSFDRINGTVNHTLTNQSPHISEAGGAMSGDTISSTTL